MSIQRVGKHTYVDVDYNGSNVGCIITAPGMVLIDTPFIPAEIKQWGEQVAKLSPKGIRYVINTHHHFDHVLGNGTYCPHIIAHESTYQELLKPDGTMRRFFIPHHEELTSEVKEQIYRIPVVLPNITFRDHLWLHLGDVNLELWHTGGHSDSSIYIYVVEDRVLFTGDVFQPSSQPYMGQGNFRLWMKVLAETEKMDFDVIVPGHDPVCGRDRIKPLLTFFRQMWHRVQKLQQEGVSRARVIKQVHDHINRYPLSPGQMPLKIRLFDEAIGMMYDQLKAR